MPRLLHLGDVKEANINFIAKSKARSSGCCGRSGLVSRLGASLRVSPIDRMFQEKLLCLCLRLCLYNIMALSRHTFMAMSINTEKIGQ